MKHRIMAHRGLWSTFESQNSYASIQAAVSRGFGFETDIRDRLGELIVGHEPSRDEDELLESIAELIVTSQSKVALNVKSDGLVPLLQAYWKGAIPDGVFFFDMSWPQTLSYIDAGLPIALRASEWEHPEMRIFSELGIKPRIWLDGFLSDWWIGDQLIESVCTLGEIYLVSPEIHGRKPEMAWEWARNLIHQGGNIYVCTDEWDKVEEVLCR